MIRIGILGYGNLGKGIENAIKQSSDTSLQGIFTRRNPSELKLSTEGINVYSISNIEKFKNDIDVMILCGGSATDLPEQGPKMVSLFNTVDSFDTHSKIPSYFESIDACAKKSGKIGIISVGWDPGLFSLNRLYAQAVLPEGKDYTFWGKGVRQGHSDAIRRIDGVLDGKQYTIPLESAIAAVRNGENPELSPRQKHRRECFVVAKEGSDLEKIERDIKTMPNYFSEYDTTVHFITQDEMNKNHSAIPHGGFVIRSGNTQNASHIIEYSLKLGSNPEFTSSVILAYARAAYKLSKKDESGARTVFDIPPSLLSPKTPEQLRKEIL